MKISLIGTRTVGKTTVGKLLAKELKIKFIDFDEFVENKLKLVGGIYGFIEKQSEKIRNLEAWKLYWNTQDKNLIEVYEKYKNLVVAIGGTTFGQPLTKTKKNARIISKNSKTVALMPHKEDNKGIEILVEREIKRNYNKEMSKEEIKKVVKRDYLSIKKLLLNKADMIIYANNKTPTQIVKEILTKLK